MRRGLASLIIGLSLLVATVSWAGFTLSRTVLDPGRSERLAEQLLENPQVRDALVDRLSDAVEPQIPPEVPVSRQLIEAGAETALDDPRVRALMVDGVVRFHRNALEGNPEPVVIDAGALGAASRDSLVAVRPELDQFLPAVPVIELELPTTGFTWLATIKRFVDRFTLLAALVALAGATLALIVARDKGAVLRRVAFWGYGAAAFWLLIAYAIPRVADVLSPTSGAIASAAVDVFFGAMIQPAIVLAIASTAVLILGLALPALGGPRGARVVQARGSGETGGTIGTGPAPVAPSPGPIARPANRPTAPAAAAPVGGSPLVTQPPVTSPARPASMSAPDPTMVGHATASGQLGTRDNTAEMPRPNVDPNSFVTDRTSEAAPSWEEGVGYVDEGERG